MASSIPVETNAPPYNRSVLYTDEGQKDHASAVTGGTVNKYA